MQQFVPCTGCGNQVLTSEFSDGMHVPQALMCETCGQEFIWDPCISHDRSAVTEFSVIDSAEISPADTEPAETEPALELELELDVPEDEDGSAAVLTKEKSPEQPSAPDWSVLGPPIKRRREQETSAIRKILPPVLGGLASFPIATLIMWYGFGKDIGSTGPTVAQYVPWIVPEKLRNTPWQYSPRDTREDSSLALRSQRSAAQPRTSFPTLNRENQVDLPSDRVIERRDPARDEESIVSVEKPTPQPEVNNKPSDKPLKSNVEPPIAKSSISETIAKLRTLQTEWNKIPVSDQAKMVKMVGDYYLEMKRLSEQSADLRGRSASVWRRELESISREILSHPHIPMAIERGAIGKLPGVPVVRLDEFVATVITIGVDNEPMPNASWTPQEKWSSGTAAIPIEILSGAWRAGSATLPATCLALGKLVVIEDSETDSSKVVLKVHSLLPK